MNTTLVCISGYSLDSLYEKLNTLLRAGMSQAELYNPKDSYIISIVAKDSLDLKKKLLKTKERLGKGGHTIDDEDGIYFESKPFGHESVAFLFPGQGSQYMGMLQSLRTVLPAFNNCMLSIDEKFKEQCSYSLLDLIYSDQTKEGERLLRDTRQAQISLGFVSIALAQAFQEMGIIPKYAVGHSYGELPALHTGGMVETDFFLKMSMTRGKLMGDAGDNNPGAMLSVFAKSDLVEQIIHSLGIAAVVAVVNAEEQIVVSGSKEDIVKLEQACEGRIKTIRLKTSGAFHSPLMKEAEMEWGAYLSVHKDQFHRMASTQVYSNVTAEAYNPHTDKVLELLTNQLTHCVRWHETCSRLYEDGARIFIEVGPGHVLTKLIGGNLKGKPFLSVHADSRNKDGLSHISHVMGKLASHGVKLNWKLLFDEQIYNEYLLDREMEGKSGMNHPIKSSKHLMMEEFFHSNQWMVRTFLEEQKKMLELQHVNMAEHDKRQLFQHVIELSTSVVLRALGAQKAGVSSFYENQAVQSTVVACENTYENVRYAAKQAAAASNTDLFAAAEQVGGSVLPDIQVRDLMLQLKNEISKAAEEPLNQITSKTNLDKLNINIFTLEEIYNRLLSAYSRYALFKQEMLHASQLHQVEKLLHYILSTISNYQTDLQTVDKAETMECLSDIKRYEYRYDPLLISGDACLPKHMLLVGMKNEMFDFYKHKLMLHDVHLTELYLTETGWATGHQGFDSISYEDIQGFRSYMESYKDEDGYLPSVMFLASNGEDVLEYGDFRKWNAQIEQTAVALFTISSLYSQTEDTQRAQHYVCVVGQNASCPVSAAARGIARTMAHDLKAKYHVRSIWLEEDYRQIPMKQIFGAICRGPSQYDIFIHSKEIRIRKLGSLNIKDTISGAVDLNASSLVVLFGGGAGITSEIACAMAERYGCRIVVVGRTSFSTAALYEDIQDDSVLKQTIFNDLSKKLVGNEQVTKAMLEQETRRVYRQRALLQTKRRIEKAGGKFHYYACDVSDYSAVNELLKEIHGCHGEITGIVHGAGEVNGQRNKTADAFRNNLSIKSSSMFSLYHFFRNYPLKFAILFSSISAYAGIPRQSDYAASNEFVNGIAAYWNRHVDYPVLSVMWSLWTETGIMKNSTHDIEKFGLKGISNNQGIHLFLRELANLDSSVDRVLLTHDSMLNFSMP